LLISSLSKKTDFSLAIPKNLTMESNLTLNSRLLAKLAAEPARQALDQHHRLSEEVQAITIFVFHVPHGTREASGEVRNH
jgi:hypothetical protein